MGEDDKGENVVGPKGSKPSSSRSINSWEGERKGYPISSAKEPSRLRRRF